MARVRGDERRKRNCSTIASGEGKTRPARLARRAGKRDEGKEKEQMLGRGIGRTSCDEVDAARSNVS